MSCKCRKMTLMFEKLRDDAHLPQYASPGAAGMDLAIPESVMIFPGHTAIIPLGWKVAVPEGFEMQIRPRSGTSIKTKLIVPNSPGTIDSDYRGEVALILRNTGGETYIYAAGTRLAQAVIARAYRPSLELVESLDDTERGEGGFGSTGL